jgi:hypothetical protein
VNHTLVRGSGNRAYILARLDRDGFAEPEPPRSRGRRLVIPGRPVGCGGGKTLTSGLARGSALPVEALLRDDAEILQMWRQATTGAKHVHHADTDNVSIKPGHGNSRAYTLDRLKRERRF